MTLNPRTFCGMTATEWRDVAFLVGVFVVFVVLPALLRRTPDDVEYAADEARDRSAVLRRWRRPPD